MSKLKTIDIDTASAEELREVVRNQRLRLREIQSEYNRKECEVYTLKRENMKYAAIKDEQERDERERERAEAELKRQREAAAADEARSALQDLWVGIDAGWMKHELQMELAAGKLSRGRAEKSITYLDFDAPVEVRLSLSVTHLPTAQEADAPG